MPPKVGAPWRLGSINSARSLAQDLQIEPETETLRLYEEIRGASEGTAANGTPSPGEAQASTIDESRPAGRSPVRTALVFSILVLVAFGGWYAFQGLTGKAFDWDPPPDTLDR